MTFCLPEKVLQQHLACLGKTGSGKTSTSKLIVEHVVAQNSRVCILDPTKSDWWGISSNASGRGPGLPFHILGGPRGHVALHSGAGAVIGELVATGQLPLSILDMADFEPGGLQRFFADFAAALIRKMRGVLYLVIEEAHEFAPKERAGFGNENLAIHWAKKLATAGRSRGIRLIVATQRTQSLHNAILGSCETMIAHRITAPADQEPVVKWLKGNLSKEKVLEVEQSLARLETGEAWVCSGEANLFERRKFPRIWTYDNTATPTDDIAQVEVKTAMVDKDRLRAIVGVAVEEAKANDPVELKKTIASLTKELGLARLSKAVPFTPAEPITVERPVLSDDDRRKLDAIREQLANNHHSFTSLLEKLIGSIPPLSPIPVRHWPAKVVRRAAEAPGSASPGLDGSQQRIIDVVAMLAVRGIGANRDSVARWLDLHPNGGSYGTNLGFLRSQGYLDGFALTERGQTAARAMPTGLEAAKVPLDGSQSRIVDMLATTGSRYTRDTLAAALGLHPNGGSYGTNLGRLRTMGLIPERGEIYLTEAAHI